MVTTTLAVLSLSAALAAPPAPSWWAAARSRDGNVLWCDESPDRADLERRAWLAFRLLGATRIDLGCSDDEQHAALLEASDEWGALVDAGHQVRVGAEARASLERAMGAARMAGAPEHVETDGAMAICNRCGAMWVPGPNPGAGPVTWGLLRLRLAEFLSAHRPCGVPRIDGRVGLAPEQADLPVAPPAPRDAVLPFARPWAIARFRLAPSPAAMPPPVNIALRLGPLP